MEVYSFGSDFLEHLSVGIVCRKQEEIIYSNKVARELFHTLGITQVCLWLDHHSTNKRSETDTSLGKLVIYRDQEKDDISYQLEIVTESEEIFYRAYQKVSSHLEEFLGENLEQEAHQSSEGLHLHAFHCSLCQQKINLSYILEQNNMSLCKCNIFQVLEVVLEVSNPWIERFGCQVVWVNKSKITALGKIEPFYFQNAIKNILSYGVALAQEEENKTLSLSLVHFHGMEYFTIEIPYTGKEMPQDDSNFNLRSAIVLLERMDFKPLLIHEGKSIRFLLTFPEEEEGFYQLLSPSAIARSQESQNLYPHDVLSFSQLILRHGTEEEWKEIFTREK